jgi:hypothetical protein
VGKSAFKLKPGAHNPFLCSSSQFSIKQTGDVFTLPRSIVRVGSVVEILVVLLPLVASGVAAPASFRGCLIVVGHNDGKCKQPGRRDLVEGKK